MDLVITPTTSSLSFWQLPHFLHSNYSIVSIFFFDWILLPLPQISEHVKVHTGYPHLSPNYPSSYQHNQISSTLTILPSPSFLTNKNHLKLNLVVLNLLIVCLHQPCLSSNLLVVILRKSGFALVHFQISNSFKLPPTPVTQLLFQSKKLSTLHSFHLSPTVPTNSVTLSMNFFIANLCHIFLLTLKLKLFTEC